MTNNHQDVNSGKRPPKALERLRIEREFESPEPNRAALWLERFQGEERDLREVWKERIEAPATVVMLALINTGDSVSDMQELRPLIREHYDIAQEPDNALVTLRNQLREFWDEMSKERNHFGPTAETGDNVKVSGVLHKWWTQYPFDSDGWRIYWTTGTFFPTQKNFRGIIARILFDKRRYLAVCPGCNRYFIKKRDDQKYCLSEACLRKANNLRQQKHQEARKSQRRSHAKRHGRKNQ